MSDTSKGGPGRKKVIDTPEFQDAVKAAVQEALAALAPTAAPPSDDDKIERMLTRLADKLGEGFANNGARRPMTAEEKGRRDAARQTLRGLYDKVEELRKEDENHPDLPAYAVMSKVAFFERFIEPFQRPDPKGAAVRTEIVYTGVPNHALEPLNALAKEIFEAWNVSVGGRPSLLPTSDNRPLFVTARGLVVRGDPPKRRTMGVESDAGRVSFRNGDPAAPDVAVLGTIAPRAKMNTVQGVAQGR